MPEGPEIAREADRIRAALQGAPVERVWFAFPELRRRAERFAGARVESVRARGKALLIGFDNALTIYSHNQLYGRWYVREIGSKPRTNRQLRMAIETARHQALLYSASEIDVLDAADLVEHPYLSKLGPDALDPDVDASVLYARLSEPRFARRSLAALLLDQSFVAGIGNYLRSEILFEAGVHPERRPGDLTTGERRRVANAIGRLARRAYEHRGVTFPPARARALQRRGVSWRRSRHWVFARGGEPCRRCARRIRRVERAGRRIYVCPACQPAPS